MTFDDILAQVLELLQREKRVSYRALKRRLDLDDDYLEDVKDELIYAKKLAVDEENRVLVWVGGQEAASAPPPVPSTSEPTAPLALDHEREPLSYTPKHLAEKILTSRSALEGERKQVTVLFCDLANSTSIAERIGPEAMHTLLNGFFERALSEVHRYEGTINQFLGDGFMALFGAPIAHEDHARRGVLSALALQRAFKEAALGHPYDVECVFRMGLNSGLVVVGSIGDNLRMDYSAIGDTTNLAARLQQGAEPDTIVVSERTSRLVQGYIRLEPLPLIEVKGKTEPVLIYKVIGTLPRRSPIASRSERTLSPFVGRERELATLEALFAQVEAGQGQVVGIVAEAGGGKSRLLYEFRQRLQGKRVTYLEGRCLSYGSTIPYHPLIDILRHNCGISETDSPETLIEKVRFALQEVGMDVEESAPYLLQLLGVQHGTERLATLTPEAIRARTFDTLKQMSLKGSQQRPLIFEIEDVHWVDKTSEAYLVSLVESFVGASMMLLTTYRPGYRPPWLEKSYATQLSLRSLTLQDSATMVHSTSHDTTLPTHLEQRIIEKAEGNPFFLEELTRAVLEHGDLQADIAVPDTIQGVLSARIDRLPEAHKRLLQTASVLGREFAPRLLQALWEEPTPLESLLMDLKRLEFLYERARGEEPVYVFKHALTQEVAYDSLLTTRRQRLHATTGRTLERLYPDWLVERSEELARHYTEAGLNEKAVSYWHKAGQRARAHFAYVETIAHVTQGLELLETLPETPVRLHTELDMQLMLGAALMATKGYGAPEVERVYTRAYVLCQHESDAPRLADVLYGLRRVYSHRGELRKACDIAEQSLRLAHRTHDDATSLESHYSLGYTLFQLGAFTTASTHLEHGIAWSDRLQHQAASGGSSRTGIDVGLCCRIILAWVRCVQGSLEHAVQHAREVVRQSQEHANPYTQAWVLSYAGLVHHCCRQVAAVHDGAARVISLCQERKYGQFEAFGTTLRGWALVHQGQAEEGLLQIQQGVAAIRALGTGIVPSPFLALYAEAYETIKQSEAGLRVLDEALTQVHQTEERYYEAEIHRLQGDLLLQQNAGNQAEAETCFHHAIRIAQSQQAKCWELRAATSLARLWQQQGKRQEAHDLLAPVYNWFTEGFDTADIKDAKALLDELA
jgi:class 3 adenylate cyclase/predicted ATPase